MFLGERRRYVKAYERQQKRLECFTSQEISPQRQLHEIHLDVLDIHSPRQLRNELLGKVIASGLLETDKDAVKKVKVAAKIAKRAHARQKRKFSKDQYIVHPLRAAHLTIEFAQQLEIPLTTELIVGALLHDTVEDNPRVSPKKLERKFRRFGNTFAQAVAADAEALNHYDEARNKLEPSAYVAKITDAPSDDVLIRRLILKAIDRTNNLLDPPQVPTGNMAPVLRESRDRLITRTDTELFPELLNVTQHEQGTTIATIKDKLSGILFGSQKLSQATLGPTPIDPSNLDQYLPNAA